MTNEQIATQLTKILQANYPVTYDFILAEIKHQRAGNPPRGFMGMVVAENIKKLS